MDLVSSLSQSAEKIQFFFSFFLYLCVGLSSLLAEPFRCSARNNTNQKKPHKTESIKMHIHPYL